MAGAAYGGEAPLRQTDDRMRLNCPFDSGCFPGAVPSDSPVDGECLSPHLSGSESYDSDSFTDFATIFRVFSDSMLKMELADIEIVKNRASSLVETERRRAESEFALTRMISQTQLQIASDIAKRDSSRKRKRIQEDDDSLEKSYAAMFAAAMQFDVLNRFVEDSLAWSEYKLDQRFGRPALICAQLAKLAWQVQVFFLPVIKELAEVSADRLIRFIRRQRDSRMQGGHGCFPGSEVNLPFLVRIFELPILTISILWKYPSSHLWRIPP
ncbi:hypothetical protein Ancab_004838 [Ancistrocladus abbreviatus]